MGFVSFQTYSIRVKIFYPAGGESGTSEILRPAGGELLSPTKGHPVGNEWAIDAKRYPLGSELAESSSLVPIGDTSPGFSPLLSLSHYRVLMRVQGSLARDFYEREAYECGWIKAQLERLIPSSCLQ